MNKFLRYSLSLVLAFVASVTFAQEVTFDFAGNNWKLPDSKAQGITKATDSNLLLPHLMYFQLFSHLFELKFAIVQTSFPIVAFHVLL